MAVPPQSSVPLPQKKKILVFTDLITNKAVDIQSVQLSQTSSPATTERSTPERSVSPKSGEKAHKEPVNNYHSLSWSV